MENTRIKKGIKFLLLRQTKLSLLIRKRKLFVSSFTKNYNSLNPQDIKPHFKTHKDTENWLNGVFDDEQKYFQDASHPMNWINMTQDGNLVGFVIFEEWNKDPTIWHARQMAILPELWRHHYGSSLVRSIETLEPGIKKIIADTRKLNPSSVPFATSHGCKILDKPHDPELSPQEKYMGLEWTKIDSKN